MPFILFQCSECYQDPLVVVVVVVMGWSKERLVIITKGNDVKNELAIENFRCVSRWSILDNKMQDSTSGGVWESLPCKMACTETNRFRC